MFGYVVLHYQNIKVTEKCIRSLKNQFKESYIVVVDNCSPNGSGKLLREKYVSDNQIKVILHDKNEGFAKGNNIGFKYLQENANIDYVVVMNNDIIIEDANFEIVIEKFMSNNNIDVCGPDMVTLNNNHQNPLALEPYSSKYLKHRIKQDRIKCILLRNPIFWNIYKKYKKSNGIVPREKQETTYKCMLHGSCVIFGPEYVRKEKYAFLPITYMYNEDAILYDYLMYKGYNTAYCSDVTILHMEGVSTSSSIQNEKKKILFRFENNVRSLEAQLNERIKYL